MLKNLDLSTLNCKVICAVGQFNHNFIIISDNWYDFKTMDMNVPIGVSTSIAAVCLIYLLSFPRMVSRNKVFYFGKTLAIKSMSQDKTGLTFLYDLGIERTEDFVE